MRLKTGVRVRGVRPEIVVAMMVANSAFEAFALAPEMVVTSCTEGRHSWTSLHYQGAAFDIRTRDASSDVNTAIVKELKDSLGPDFDVILEDTHIHIEYQPKGE